MASPDSEWLLWREQYKIHAKSVSQQLSSLTQVTSQIENVTTKNAELVARSDHLKAENGAIRERIVSLEKNLSQQDKLNERLQTENDTLRDRVVRLEQDANQQDQINAMSSQANDDLQTKLEKLKGDFINVIEAVGTMQATTRAERESQRIKLTEMKAQMEAFIAAGPQGYPTQASSDAKDIEGLCLTEPRGNRAARDMSEATTADESMQIEQNKESQILKVTQFNDLPGTTQLYTQYPDQTQPRTSTSTISMAAQGPSSIEAYIKYGDTVVAEGLKLYEIQAVKRFISGLKDVYAQQVLTDKLEKVGWTWGKAKEELHRMIEGGRRRKRNRRTMPAFA